MDGRFTASSDGVRLHFLQAGSGATALVFLHGWLGNAGWWRSQLEAFADRFTVVAMDLPGHGRSGSFPGEWSSQGYARAIGCVLEAVAVERCVLVGHSMAGAYALEASLHSPEVSAVVLVDTLKNLDRLLTPVQAEELLLRHYRADFRDAVARILPQHLFASSTPAHVRERLQSEFLSHGAEHAIRVIQPLYGMEVRGIARAVRVPVRSLNSDSTPTDVEANRRYLRDYAAISLGQTGHYPMLEQPDAFNQTLGAVLRELQAAGPRGL